MAHTACIRRRSLCRCPLGGALAHARSAQARSALAVAAHARPVAPRGITLLEVLISLFVLTVGLLGMVILSTVGVHQLEIANQLDQGATVGRAAHRDLLIRGHLQPAAWAAYAPVSAGGPWINASNGLQLRAMDNQWTFYEDNGLTQFPRRFGGPPSPNPQPPLAFVIDPMMMAPAAPNGAPINTTSVCTFPYADTYPTTPTHAPALPRFTLWTSPGNSMALQPMPAQFADRIFRSADDLVFAEREVNQDRPTQVVDVLGNGASNGRFSWFATVTASFDEMYATPLRTLMPDDQPPNLHLGPASTNDVERMRKFTVSVVVCDRRDFVYPPAAGEVPAERMVPLRPLDASGAVFRSGEAKLGLTGFAAAVGATEEWLATIRPGQWIMLSGQIGRDLDLDSSPNEVAYPILQWYRVASASAVANEGTTAAPQWTRYVTLQGPDWPANTTNVHATIVDGAIGVYQKDVRFEGQSQWQ